MPFRAAVLGNGRCHGSISLTAPCRVPPTSRRLESAVRRSHAPCRLIRRDALFAESWGLTSATVFGPAALLVVNIFGVRDTWRTIRR